jgi:hypothetical protein
MVESVRVIDAVKIIVVGIILGIGIISITVVVIVVVIIVIKPGSPEDSREGFGPLARQAE